MRIPISSEVVVTDYRLPGINGALLIKQVRMTGLCFRAVVISAYTDQATINEAKEAGATFLSKPVDFELLGLLVREVLA